MEQSTYMYTAKEGTHTHTYARTSRALRSITAIITRANRNNKHKRTGVVGGECEHLKQKNETVDWGADNTPPQAQVSLLRRPQSRLPHSFSTPNCTATAATELDWAA